MSNLDLMLQLAVVLNPLAKLVSDAYPNISIGESSKLINKELTKTLRLYQNTVDNYQERYDSIDTSNFYKFMSEVTPDVEDLLNERYKDINDSDLCSMFRRSCAAYALDNDHAQRLFDYICMRWFMFASPILSNGGTRRGLPISCFLPFVEDSRKGILGHISEVAMLSSVGGGVGGSWSAIRSKGEKTSKGSASSGVIPFIKVADSTICAFHQGGTRRGAYASYMHISHPEIEEFLILRKPTGGDPNRKALNIHNAIVIDDKFMNIIKNCIEQKDYDDSYDLVDPNSKQVVKTISAKKLWEQILSVQHETGEPYIMFEDNVNNSLKPWMKKYPVVQSNVCSEIIEFTNEIITAVCALSSFNMCKYDEFLGDTNFVSDILLMINIAMNYFIVEASKTEELHNACRGAFFERSTGLGTMGFHDYLQSKNVAIESSMSRAYNHNMFSWFQNSIESAQNALRTLTYDQDEHLPVSIMVRAYEASQGVSCERVNAQSTAIAPNAKSSTICNTSPSIEPWAANYFVRGDGKGTTVVKNKYLVKLLESKGENTPEVWKSILDNRGSVQHLEFLSQDEKDVFKTARELDQRWLVQLAADRQQYIDQSQSLNLFFSGVVPAWYAHEVRYLAWKLGVKSLYYTRGQAAQQGETLTSQIKLEKPVENEEECFGCEG